MKLWAEKKKTMTKKMQKYLQSRVIIFCGFVTTTNPCPVTLQIIKRVIREIKNLNFLNFLHFLDFLKYM